MTSSSRQKTQHRKKSFCKGISRKCTKYNFVTPLSFTDSYSLILDQKFPAVPTWDTNKNFIESSLRFDLTFTMSDFGYSSNSGFKQKHPK